MAAPNFWDSQERAQETVGRLKSVKAIVAPMTDLIAQGDDLQALLEMAEEDDSIEDEVRKEIQSLESMLDDLELKSLLNGPHDGSGAIMTFHARDGGTDANDWAEMLLRMYTQWAAKNDYEVVLFDRNNNPEAGINSASIAIRGPMAYGYLKGETGLHRLVRISPFNSEGKRQTSFAAVDVTPEVSDSMDIDINESEVRTDTYRAQGAGGQHVNKTASAIRITHHATGVVVKCFEERSQHKNLAKGMRILKSKLYDHFQQQENQQRSDQRKSLVGSGDRSQRIRTYNFPENRVTDHRIGLTLYKLDQIIAGSVQMITDALIDHDRQELRSSMGAMD